MRRTLPEGAKVKYWHERATDPEMHVLIEPRGGKTVAKIILPDGSEITGEARCSDRDNYSKKIGRDIALGRALKSLEV